MTTVNNYKQYTTTCQHVTNYLNNTLSSTESRVLLFIINRTIRFNKTKEEIPIRHFLDGVVSKKGEAIVGGVGVSKSSLIRALKSLKEKGLICVRIVGRLGTNYFTLMLDNVWRLINMEVGKLKTSRKYRNSSVKMTPPQCQNETTYKEEDIEVEETSKETTARGVSRSAKEAIDSGIDQYNKALKKKVAKADEATVPSIRAVWNKAIADYKLDHPDAVVLPPTQNAYYRLSRSLKFRFGEDTAWKNIISETISDWDELLIHLKWMNSIPPSPSLDFIQKHFKRITEFAHREHTTTLVEAKRKEERDALRKAASAEMQVNTLLQERATLVADIQYARELKHTESQQDLVVSKELQLEAMNKKLEKQQQEINRLRSLTSFEEAEGHDLPAWEDLQD